MSVITAGKTTALSVVTSSPTAVSLLGDTQGKVNMLAQKIEHALERVKTLDITSQDQVGDVNDILALCKLYGKDAEGVRKDLTQPHVVAQRQINAVFKPLSDAVDAITKECGRKIQSFLEMKALEQARRQQEEQRKRAEADRLAAEAQAALMVGTEQEAEAAQEKAQLALVDAHQSRVEVVRTDVLRSTLGVTQMRPVARVRINDMGKVPRKFLEAALENEARSAEAQDRQSLLQRVLLQALKGEIDAELLAAIQAGGVEPYEDMVPFTRTGLQ